MTNLTEQEREGILKGKLPDLLKAISQIDEVVGILKNMFGRPQTALKNVVISQLQDARGAVRSVHEAIQSRPTIVCLCGSTRFSQAFHDVNLHETLSGKIVLSRGCDTKSDAALLLAGEMTSEKKASLDELHLRKIDLADEVLVLNHCGYIGASTTNEIAYALAHGKPIRWLEEDQAPGLLTLDDIRTAYATDETLEYHVMGNENDPSHYLPEPGWYPCVVTWPEANGNVEIELLNPEDVTVTVLGKNIPVAFRRQAPEEPPTGATQDERAVTQHFAQGEIDAGTAAYMLSLERPTQKGHPFAEWCAWLSACLHEITESFFDLSTTPEIRFEPCGDGKSCFCHFHTSVYGELVPLDGEPFLVLHDYAPYLDGDPKEVA